MTDMMLEVNDELRAQQIKALWAKYGQWAIGLFVATVLATALGSFWHNHKNRQLEGGTDQLLALLQTESKDTAAALGKLQTTAHAPLKAVIALQRAQRLEQDAKAAEARTAYQQIADDRSAPDMLRDLARLHTVRLGLVAKDKPETLLAQLEPLTADKSAFRPSALEMKAILLQQQNKNTEANAILRDLSTDATAPATLRQRALTLISNEAK